MHVLPSRSPIENSGSLVPSNSGKGNKLILAKSQSQPGIRDNPSKGPQLVKSHSQPTMNQSQSTITTPQSETIKAPQSEPQSQPATPTNGLPGLFKKIFGGFKRTPLAPTPEKDTSPDHALQEQKEGQQLPSGSLLDGTSEQLKVHKHTRTHARTHTHTHTHTHVCMYLVGSTYRRRAAARREPRKHAASCVVRHCCQRCRALSSRHGKGAGRTGRTRET